MPSKYILQTNYQDAIYTPRGGAAELIYSHDPEVILAGPAECLAGESKIYDPETGLHPTIEYLYKNQIAPTVLTLFGKRKADIPFRKGYDALYRVTLENGFSFVATKKHRVLTKRGWLFVGMVLAGESLLISYAGRPLSTSESSPSMSLQDAQSYLKITQDSQSCYFAGYHLLYDARPPREANISLDAPPLLADVLIHNRADHKTDDPAFLCVYNHPRLCAGLPSNGHSVHGYAMLQRADEVCCVSKYTHGLDGESCQSPSLSQLDFYPLQPFYEVASLYEYRQKLHESFDNSPNPDYTVFSSTVRSIEYARRDYFYDLTVPDAGHYLADGFWHHNTGKTLASCWKSHLICSKYPGAQVSLLRKTYGDIAGTVYLTLKRVLKDAPVYVYGGDNKPQKIIYSNGSVIWIGGMDKPGKTLSGERDAIQVCQYEEFNIDDIELLSTRVTGRGAIIPHPQLFGDCNPGPSRHPIIARQKAGGLKLLKSVHRDNPTLFDEAGNITEQGVKTMARLDALTGVRRKRLRDGIWATAEGAIFDMFDSQVGGPHVRIQKRENYRSFRLTMDEGYNNPAVILVIGIDSDGRRHIFKEFYESGKLERDVVAKAVELGKEYNTKEVTCDDAAAGLIAALRDAGLLVQGGKGRITDRINAIQDDLAVQDDGRSRLTIDPSCVNTINDMESYEWKEGRDEPKKENDHGPDALGYDYDTHEKLGGGFGLGYKNRKPKR